MEIEHSDKKYRVMRELGRGHSGTVYLALDSRGKEVAIKCLASQTNEAMLQRFRQEFAILRSLQHPHIAQPVDFGFDEALRRHFFVAEYLAGTSLDVALHTATEDQAAEWLAQALRALDYMHRQGVFHCDLKPGNILVTHQGVLKIIDFDVAVRGTQAIGGTPSYCAPELLAGEGAHPDAKTDLFSIGATFYHCLTREKPFQAQSFAEMVAAHSSQIPKLPSQINPRLGTLWDALLMGLLQVNPSRRYATASAALQQLYPLLGGKKFPFSEEDIGYRLRQHGAPIGKEGLLSQVQYFLDRPPEGDIAKHLAVLRGGPGLGAGYLAAEIRALAQLRGLPCFGSDARERSVPGKFPSVWVIDEFSRQWRAEGREFSAWLDGKIQELAYKAGEAPWWLFLVGIDDDTEFPAELRGTLASAELQLRLQPWNLLETKAWLAEIFQSEEIPEFLAARIQEESLGNARRAQAVLQGALRRGLVLDRQGQWRRDLYHPSELFRREFAVETGGEDLARRFASLSEEERDILEGLALAYHPLPPSFFEKWLGRETVYASLRHLAALGAAKTTAEESYRLASETWKDFLLKELGEPELRRRHDRWSELAQDPRLAEYFSQEAVLFHRAHGQDKLVAAQAWMGFGDRNARGGFWQSAEECYSKALEVAPKEERDLRFRCAIDKGRCIVQRGRLDEAKAYFEALLKKFTDEKKQNRQFLAKICERLGVIETKRGHPDKAREYFRNGLRCLEPKREPLEQYLGLQNFLAALDLAAGRLDEAIAAYRESDTLAKKLPRDQSRVLTNNDLGAALLRSGQFDAAISHWRSQLEDLRSREDWNPYVRCLYQMGQAYLDHGDKAEAEEYLELAAVSGKDLQNPEMELRLRNALANCWKDSQAEQSLANYELALDAAFQTGEAIPTAVVLLNMGFLLAELEQWARARHCLEQGSQRLRASPGAETQYGSVLREAEEELAKCAEALRREAAGGLELSPAK